METKQGTITLFACEQTSDMTVELPVEGDFTIPDYQAEIFKIVKTKAEPVVMGKLAVGNRATVEGYVKLTVLYLSNEEARLCSMSQRIPFSKQFDLKEAVGERYAISADVAVSYLNCRAVSERRLDARGALTISPKILSFKTVEAQGSLMGENIFERSKTVECTTLSRDAVKQFSIEELLSSDLPAGTAATVIRCEARAVVDGAESFDNRVEVKGTVYVNVALDLSGEAGLSVKRMGYKIPFTQVVDIEGVTAGETAIAEAYATSCTVFPEVTSEGMIEATVALSLGVGIYDAKSAVILKDAFSTNYEMSLSSDVVSVMRAVVPVNTGFSFAESFDKPKGSLIDYFIQKSELSLVREEEGAFLKTVAQLCCIFVDEEGETASFDKQLEIRTAFSAQGANAAVYDLSAVFENLECVEIGDKLSLKAGGTIVGRVSELEKVPVIRSARADETKPKQKPDAALFAYYAEVGEEVFDIARQFGASPEEIMKENEIEDGALEYPAVLLIPIVE